jgi:DNA polymerase-4
MDDTIWQNHKVIMHIDMDAFFAAIEQKICPALQGRPVIVGGTPESRGVVSTCSYEARNYGVHSAMPMKKAYQLCPDGVFVDTSGDKYSYMSVMVLEILQRYSMLVEPVSIDESFLDITAVHQRYGGPAKIAMAIKNDIKAKIGLTASIGIAPNKLIAKMASSSQKPDGLVIIPPDEVKQFLWCQPVQHLWGVGPKSAAALNSEGIQTIGDLAQSSKPKLKKMFGILGEALVGMANGDGDSDVRSVFNMRDAKSVGHEHTFHRDTNDIDTIMALLLYLSDKVSRRLRLHGYEGKTIRLKIRKSDFTLLTRAHSLTVFTDTEKDIFKYAREMFFANEFQKKPIRLLGVSMGNVRLKSETDFDDFLIDYSPQKSSRRIDKVMDSLREKHGESVITFARTSLFKDFDSP